MKMRSLFHRCSALALFFPCLFLFLMSPIEFRNPEVRTDTAYELTPPFFKLVTFGFWPAAVDALWIRTLQGIGDRGLSKATAPELSRFYRLAQNLDPFFFETYQQGAIAFSMLTEEPDFALEVLNRGIKVYETGGYPKHIWDRPFILYLYRSYVNGFLKNDFYAAKEDYLAAEAAPGAPAYLHDMKKWLKNEGSERILAGKILRSMIKSSADPLIRKKLQEKLKTYE
jgi:hypothetical protein